MMGAFQEMASAWAAAGIVPLPIYPDGKGPMVKRPGAFRRPAAMELAANPRFAAANLGFMCGAQNGLTLVDVDSSTDAELQHALTTYGDSPVLSQTPGGGRHAYYQYSGERRRIRPDKGHPIDILGEGGLAVAPPSTKPDGRRYGWLRGGLADLRNLPTMRAGALQKLVPASVERAAPIGGEDTATICNGQRNCKLFKMVCMFAWEAKSKDDLEEQALKANVAFCDPPLSDAEVRGRVRSAWKYKMEGRLMATGGESCFLLPSAQTKRLLAEGELDVVAVLNLVRQAHGHQPDKPFAMAPEAMARAGCIGRWDEKHYRRAIKRTCDLGILERISQGGRGPNDPAKYRFPPSVKGVRFAPQY
jgi:hypothetical protein